MSDSFGFEKIEREQADQDENITSSSMTENVGEEAPEEDMFRDDIPQKGANLLDDSLGGGDVYSNEATPAEPLISFGSPVAEPSAPSLPPQKIEPVADSTPVSTKTAATSGEGCWMKTVDPREDIDNTSLKSEMDETSPSNSDSTSPPISAESLAGPFNGDRTNIGDITSDTNKYFDKDSDSSSVISSSDNEYSSSADESDSESANDMSDTCDLAAGESLNAFKPDTNTLQDIDSAGLDYKQLKMEVNQENVGVDLLGTVESRELDKVDAVVENDEVESMEKDLSRGAEFDPQEAEEDFDNAPVAGNNVSAAAGLSEMDMLDVIERLTKEDNAPVEVCSAESLDNSNQMQAVKDEDYERFIRGEEVYSVDNASPVVSDNDSVGSESGSRDSDISDSDQDNVCSDSDVSGDEANIGNWSPSPLYSGTLSFGNDDEDEDDNEAMEVEETGVLAGYEYEAEGSGAVNQDNELNSLRADVKGLMEEMEAIVNENDESKDKAESQTYVSGVIEEMNKGESERIPAVLKTNEHIVSIMSSGSRERSKTPDNAHVKFQNPTNILFYDPDCPIVEKVSAEVADELIDHDQSYVDQPETELKITEDKLDQTSETTEPDDLGAAVIKDLKDVYNNLEAKGEIEATVCGSPPSDNRTIDDMASEFSNEVLEEARRETFESLKNIPDHYGKHELEVTDSLYRKKPRVETDYKPENDFDNQNNEPLEISEEVLASEVRKKNECDPFSNNSMFELGKPGAALLPQKDVDAVSEKEMKSQLLAEKDEFGSKEDDLADNINEDTDDVEIRPKSGRLAELSHEEEEFEGRPDSSRSGSMIIHDEDDSEVQTDVAEAVKQTLAEYNKSSRIKALNEELELEGNVFHSDEDISTSTSSMIIHDDEKTEVPDDMTETDQQTLETNPDLGSSINDKIETNAEHMEHHKVGLDELERKRRYSSDNVIVGDHNLLAHETYDNVASQPVENDIESEQECVDEQFEVFDNSLNETVIAAERNVLDESVNEILNEKGNDGTEQSINVSPNDQSDLIVEDKNIALERKRALQIVSDTIQRVLTEVLDLIYWRDVKKTGVVFGTMLFILLSLTFFTILSVAAYLSLAILTVTLSFRVYKNVMQAVQKTNDGHPFKKLLAVEISLSEDVVQNAAEKIAGNMNNCCKELRRLFLVEDYVDSLKFGLLLWLMTYVGSWFNGMTLVILAVVCIFTLPKVYETYQGPIDQNVNLVRAQLNNIMTQVSSKIPFPKKKAKTQ